MYGLSESCVFRELCPVSFLVVRRFCCSLLLCRMLSVVMMGKWSDDSATLAQLRSRYCKLIGSYKSRIKKDASLDVCADCGKTPHNVKHLFACLAHLTTLIPSDLWRKPVESIREFSYLEEGSLDWVNQDLWRTTTTCS